MSPQYEWDLPGYVREFFARMTKNRKHYRFRNWMRAKGYINKGSRLTSYRHEYLLIKYKEFNDLNNEN